MTSLGLYSIKLNQLTTTFSKENSSHTYIMFFHSSLEDLWILYRIQLFVNSAKIKFYFTTLNLVSKTLKQLILLKAKIFLKTLNAQKYN